MLAWPLRVLMVIASFGIAPAAFAQSAPAGETARLFLSSLATMVQATCRQRAPQACPFGMVMGKLAAGIPQVQARCSGGDQSACQSLVNWDQSIPGMMRCPEPGAVASSEATQACQRGEFALTNMAAELGLGQEYMAAAAGAMSLLQPGPAASPPADVRPAAPPGTARACTDVQIQAMSAAGLARPQIEAACGPATAEAPAAELPQPGTVFPAPTKP